MIERRVRARRRFDPAEADRDVHGRLHLVRTAVRDAEVFSAIAVPMTRALGEVERHALRGARHLIGEVSIVRGDHRREVGDAIAEVETSFVADKHGLRSPPRPEATTLRPPGLPRGALSPQARAARSARAERGTAAYVARAIIVAAAPP